MAAKEMPIEERVDKMTKAHKHHAKSIEILEQRGRNLNERLEHTENILVAVHRSINRLLEHLDITIEVEDDE